MGAADFARLIFQKVFTDDIERLRGMEDMWKNKTPPTALSFDELSEQAKGLNPDKVVDDDQTAWSLAENFAVFVDSLQRLSKRMEALKSSSSNGDTQPVLSFDKDDEDMLDFVAAAANLRSHIFGIATQSEFEIKRMAGNIIPAIATTNAIIAGLAVLQSLKLLRGPEHYAEAVPVFIPVGNTERRLTSEGTHASPKPNCPVCSVPYTQVKVNLENSKLGDLVDRLKDVAGYTDEIGVTTGDARIVYDPDLEDNLDKSFRELGIGGGTFLTITDEREEDAKVDLVLSVKEGEGGELVLLTEKLDIPKKVIVSKAAEEVVAAVNAKGMKRKADEAELGDGNPKKKGKAVDNGDDGEVIMVDDSGDGSILIE